MPSHPPGYGFLSYGGSGASGSGEREQDAGRRLSVSHGTRARSYWPLVLTKPKSGEHGARGASWRDKSPFWMSSTQWGMVETVWAEGGVTGGSWAACVTLLSCLWVSPYGIRGAHFLQASSCAIAIVFAITRRLEVNFVIYRSSAAPYVRVFLVCPPTHPGMGFSRTGVLGPAGAGSGGRMQAGGSLSRHLRALLLAAMCYRAESR